MATLPQKHKTFSGKIFSSGLVIFVSCLGKFVSPVLKVSLHDELVNLSESLVKIGIMVNQSLCHPLPPFVKDLSKGTSSHLRVHPKGPRYVRMDYRHIVLVEVQDAVVASSNVQYVAPIGG